jgi:molybdopterin-guanine dinucleotide biosynthesis protein B
MVKSPAVIEFKGFSKSGKTASILSLIRYLKSRGYSVSSVKHIHIEDFSIDEPGKNTYEMSKAGADPVVSFSSKESAFIFKRKLQLDEIISKITLFSEVSRNQIILCEGFYDGRHPLILCLKNFGDFYNLLELFSQKPNFEEILRSISCLCGVLAGKVISEDKDHILRKEIRESVESFFTITKKNVKFELINHLKDIPIKDFKENPSGFEELFLK